ncbi:hypothetical protein ACN20G_33200 (plasmid) [Streptomyces sp. BI20]|uniref:hypothetical protein n=1 Tax=Streptomyces sp. BI20 TaxID=3403460 RepID=UPI003C781EED
MRTTFRRSLTVAATTGLITALALPVGSALAADADTSPGADTSVTGTATPHDDTDPGTQSQDQSQGQGQTLDNGAVAHVFPLPDAGYTAWITLDGARIANLSADHPTATVNGFRYELNQANGFVGVLHPDGWHSEQDRPRPLPPTPTPTPTPPKPKPTPTPTPTPDPDEQDLSLSNGAVAHVHTLPGGGYTAWITLNGARIANLGPDHPTATVNGFRYELNQANGFVGVLHPDGWHSEQDRPRPTPTPVPPKPRPEPTATHATHAPVVPKGGVAAGGTGAEGGTDTLLAGVGGAAALTAGGLGFVALRRRRAGR